MKTHVIISSDGLNWTTIPETRLGPAGLNYGDYGFVAGGLSEIATSPDGVSWTIRGIEPDAPRSAAIYFANGTCVAVGDGGLIKQTVAPGTQPRPLLGGLQTANGFDLTAITPPGKAYTIQVSTNLQTWSDNFTVPTNQLVTPFLDTGEGQHAYYRIISR